jgi:hypothetical protein
MLFHLFVVDFLLPEFEQKDVGQKDGGRTQIGFRSARKPVIFPAILAGDFQHNRHYRTLRVVHAARVKRDFRRGVLMLNGRCTWAAFATIQRGIA